jgi:hypothetical protein
MKLRECYLTIRPHLSYPSPSSIFIKFTKDPPSPHRRAKQPRRPRHAAQARRPRPTPKARHNLTLDGSSRCRGRPKSNLCSWPPPSQATISASAPLLAPPTAYPLSRDLLTQPRDRPSLSAVDATVYNIMSVRACMATKLRLRAWTS